MSDPARDLEIVEEAQIKKTAAYHGVKNGFSLSFLQGALSYEISKLVELQSHTISMLEEMINSLKKRPLNGGSE